MNIYIYINEDVCPIENEDIPASYVGLTKAIWILSAV